MGIFNHKDVKEKKGWWIFRGKTKKVEHIVEEIPPYDYTGKSGNIHTPIGDFINAYGSHPVKYAFLIALVGMVPVCMNMRKTYQSPEFQEELAREAQKNPNYQQYVNRRGNANTKSNGNSVNNKTNSSSVGNKKNNNGKAKVPEFNSDLLL